MSKLGAYLHEYGLSHRNATNLLIHKICVPLIMWSLLGFLHTFELFEGFYASYLLALLALIFYASLQNARVFFTMAAVTALMLLSFFWIPHLRIVSLVVFALAWVGQFYGHHVEGVRPSFFKDLLFLLIGPVWVVHSLFPRFLFSKKLSRA